MDDKGFTLIELLAVLVILSVIALITIPTIIGIIDLSKKQALKNSANGLIKAGGYYYSSKLDTGIPTTEFICSDNQCVEGDEQIDYAGYVEEGRIKVYGDGHISICVENDKYAASKKAKETTVTVKEGKCNYIEDDYEIETVVSIKEYDELNKKYNELKSKGTAIETDILDGKTAIVKGKEVTGSMINNGILNWNPSGKETYNISSGYYSGGILSTDDAYNSGYNEGAASASTVGWSCSYQDNVASSCTSSVNIGPGKNIIFVGATNMQVSVDTSSANGSGSVSSSYNSSSGIVTITYQAGGRWTYRTCTASGYIVYR